MTLLFFFLFFAKLPTTKTSYVARLVPTICNLQDKNSTERQFPPHLHKRIEEIAKYTEASCHLFTSGKY
jgi:hypothetical protein